MSKPVVAIVGANGVLAKNLIAALLSPAYNDTISFPIRLVTGNVEKTKTLEAVAASPELFDIYKADILSGEGLAKPFTGATAVVNLVGVYGFSHNQITDAAADAGSVKLYIPSEFGVKTTKEKLGKYAPIFGVKLSAREHALTKSYKTVAVFNGLFTEFAFTIPGLGGFVSDSRIEVYSPDADYTTTSLPDVGRAIAAIVSKSLDEDEIPDQVVLRGDTINGKKLAEIYEKIKSTKVEYVEKPAEDILSVTDKIVDTGYAKDMNEFGAVLIALFSQGFTNLTPNYEEVTGSDFKFESATEVAERLFK
ncbi:uncharacterized protein SAPINGB_P004646 [Magnusiomyces paraingens]|uniref:NmrA-like domain-containing protein n=1 Tax=Magnusiomyces paraingens TaxID=2606893 RepID=A0A5E8BY41_9ASCO|nr:uncharacterized protein SAPINGB_P004646 [Saprochaete ingens]VVT55549.1 unnamed protein product [Saprochaete ingens]